MTTRTPISPANGQTRTRLTSPLLALAILATGVLIGTATQQFAVADVSSGDRPVLIPIEPCRLVDTRAGSQVGPRSVKLGPGDTHTIDVTELGTLCEGKIPADAIALSTNITALGATELSFLTVWAGGERPLAASLNPAPGEPPVPNAVTTEISVDQEFLIYNNAGSVHVVVDVNGYYVNHNHDDRYSLLDHNHDDRYPRTLAFETVIPSGPVPSNFEEVGSLEVATTGPGALMITLSTNLNAINGGGLANCVIDGVPAENLVSGRTPSIFDSVPTGEVDTSSSSSIVVLDDAIDTTLVVNCAGSGGPAFRFNTSAVSVIFVPD